MSKFKRMPQGPAKQRPGLTEIRLSRSGREIKPPIRAHSVIFFRKCI